MLLILDTSKHADRLVVWHCVLRTTVDSVVIPCDSPFYDHGPERNEFVSKFIAKSLVKAAAMGKGKPATDPAMEKALPAVHEFLTCLDDGTGKPRETATLNIFVQDGMWKAFLNDRHSGMSLCVSSESFQGVLGALEREIQGESPGWRPMRSSVPQKPKR